MSTVAVSEEKYTSATEEEVCFHCGLPVPPGSTFHSHVLGEDRPMCCPGCQAVADAIVENGMEDYYRHRTEPGVRPADNMSRMLEELSVFDRPEMQKSFVANRAGDTREASLILEGIVCSACVWLTERHVRQLPGVISFSVNFSTHRAQVSWDNRQIKLSEILHAIAAIGYRAHPYDPNRQDRVFKRERHLLMQRLAVAGLVYLQVMMISLSLYFGDYLGINDQLRYFFWWMSLILSTPIVLYSGQAFFKPAWRDLKQKQVGMDLPVSLSIILAYAGSAWAVVTNSGHIYFDSVTMFIALLLGGRLLELSARHKAGEMSESLTRLVPAVAHRIEPDGSVLAIPAFDLVEDDRVLIRPGDAVPADGVVHEGESSVNAAMLTGESVPESKYPGAELVAGTINTESPLVMTVRKVGQDTLVSSIVRLIDRAQSQKPKISELADRFARKFVFALLGITVVITAIWLWIDPSKAFWVAVAILAITCPCSISLATPSAIAVAVGRMTRSGVLVTRGYALEGLAHATHVVFDKTGTLTDGQLAVQRVESMSSFSADELLLWSGSLEQQTEHSVGRAIVVAAKRNGALLPVTDVKNHPGRGMTGMVFGHGITVGNQRLFDELGIAAHIDFSASADLQVLIAIDGNLAGVVHLSDTIRADAKAALDEIVSLGLKPMILSGDHEARVAQMAKSLGVELAEGGLLPAEKLARVEQLQSQGAVVLMVGDGINDAPVLAQAQVSMAMGGGTVIARHSSDIVLINDQLKQIPFSLRYSRRVMANIKENLGWSVVYNAIAIPLAAAGFVQPWAAAIGMSLSSILVVGNALRLRWD
ncbi:heavy metal translocating P-type ATPase [Halothiobacillus neapolitanus]|uniref:Heavy metal translocating P-type ATPase n=1 Tax=Halothiobacillus neapolitanus (strain ATCC 23641 / DSM 15147 / CIP 104769 / NCIMB 8539 / c2) TaxID=555778 RepID=D0L1X3_HALNC|nr:heavy metal translocating P-type ATPase [Halothiobacillus neapolitanus]ACX96696.1 heavy metal translocating P-type ATPase [Halothiobacillus neapolitanus c2]